MTQQCWLAQIERLKEHFGERHFNKEFCLLVAIEITALPDHDIVNIVTTMIGSRLATRPPLIVDFRDERLRLEKKKLESDARSANIKMNSPAFHTGLKKYLATNFPGCKTVNEAVEVRRINIMIQRANDPNYEPMKDSKWI